MNKENKIDNKAIKNVIDFLNSSKEELMEHCYFSIIDDKRNRWFKNSIEICSNEEFDSLFSMVSVVILTANKIECDSLNYIAYRKTKGTVMKRRYSLPIFKGGDACAPDAYIFKISSSYILHLNAFETGSNTPGGSTDLIRFISNNVYIKPNCIISYGVCYGRDPANQQIGDVLIPKKLYPWSVGQKLYENKIKIKNDNFNLNLEHEFSESKFYSIIRDFYNNEDGITLEDSICCGSDESINMVFSVKNIVGNMSTGEAVISSRDIKDKVRAMSGNDDEIGGEMEGYGIAKECIYYADIPCIIIKAICDWGECKDIDVKLREKQIICPEYLKDKLQAYAAFCAGVSLFKLLESEQERFFSLKLFKWMDDKKRGNSRCGENNYVDKNVIIDNIKRFYNLKNKVLANHVFDTMLDYKLFEASIDDINQFHVKNMYSLSR